DFVKLDNLSVAYNINVDNDYIKNIRLSLSGQNVFTITNYTGTTPEPSLQDDSSAIDNVNNDVRGEQNRAPNLLAPGIDRRNSYFASRTITLGLNVNF
ncbi:MAG: TonB-dependent receptor, partial [Flavobacteriaceae bacterium]